MSEFNAWYQQQQNGGSGDEESGLLGGLNSAVSEGMNNLRQGMPTLSLKDSSPPVLFGLDYATRFKLFVSCLFLSGLFFVLGIFVGLPVLALRPQKFALCFTFGSLTFMASFAMIKGPAAHLQSMLTPDRWFFTVVYVTSMMTTLYCTFNFGGVSGYFVVLGSCLVQILALLWYLVTFLPGGSAGMTLVTSALRTMLAPIAKGCSTCVGMCFRSAVGA